MTGVPVFVYAAISRALPAGPAREAGQAVVVLATATLVSFLPALWVVARGIEGIAGAAAVGLWGTIVFTAIDIVVLRPANHLITIYPWTWDAVGGLSTWWYLPIWWMLGTFVAWMGGLLTAGRAARLRGGGGAGRGGAPEVLRLGEWRRSRGAGAGRGATPRHAVL